MIRDERGVIIRNLGIAPIVDLLHTSKRAIRAYRIPVESAVWDTDRSRLAFTMRTSLLHQGHPRISFGGFVDVALHTATGVAASIRARELWDKPVLAQVFVVLYKRSVPVDYEIGVEAVAHALPFPRRVMSVGRIFDAHKTDRTLDVGLMWLLPVDRVRTPHATRV